MHVPIHIEEHYEFQQTGWTIGPCDGCCTYGVVRIEDHLRVTTGFPFPASRLVIGEAAHCDFCERALDRLQAGPSLDLPLWSRQEGTYVLAKRLGVVAPQEPRLDDERRLLSLLDNTEASTHPGQIDVKWGLRIGAAIGIALGVPTGYYLFPKVFWQLDAFGSIFAGILSGAVTGAVIGAILWVIVRPHSLATQKLRAAYGRYPFDCKCLQRLSSTYSSRLQSAVSRLADSVSLHRFDDGRPKD